MTIKLSIAPEAYRALVTHLLPQHPASEEAAFLFAEWSGTGKDMSFRVADIYFAKPADFVSHEDDYLELTDEARIELIMRAHRTGHAIIETHSHLGPYRARFSPSDCAGLRETVPHMQWRLRNRPYGACVFTRREFDALIWVDDGRTPQSLAALVVGDQTFTPTNMSLRDWL